MIVQVEYLLPRALPALFAIALGSFACSDESGPASLPDDPVPPPGPSGGGGGSAFAGAPSAGTGGASPGGGMSSGSTAGEPTINLPTNSGGGASMDEFAECAASSSTAELRPVNMFIQFDRSGSMMYTDAGDLLPVDKWAQSASALTAFFTDAKSDGLNVALRFFPHNDPVPGCIGSARFGGGTPAAMTCDAMSCAQPLVALGPLLAAPGDPQEAALLAAIAGATPNNPQTPEGQTYTPMYPALEGALIWARATLAAKPEEQTVVVLVTDGEPSACEQRIDQIAALAQAAHDELGIRTYAIGIQGSQEATMNQIAIAGGTERAYFSSDAQTAQQDLLTALNQIRGSVLSCSYQFPPGDNLDPDKINVQFTGPSGMPLTLARTDPSQCADGGWYYDDPAAPTSIALCDTTCSEVQGTGQAKLEILVGCQTRIR